MAKQNRNTLKGYFETGDIPTGANYVDLIDSPVMLDTENTGSLNLQGTGSFSEISISSTGSFGSVSASGTGSFENILLGFFWINLDFFSNLDFRKSRDGQIH